MFVDQIINKVKPVQKPSKRRELPLRSLVKAISWRIVGTIDTVVISWWIAGDFTIALSIGAVELTSKTLLYFVHERIWTRVKWGNN
ncbi:MAG TPA: DUF2061 domain-containing protein [Sphingobacterium sp.]|nr:DUF2061 domain-containing protein [Sphingobacterium sp.]